MKSEGISQRLASLPGRIRRWIAFVALELEGLNSITGIFSFFSFDLACELAGYDESEMGVRQLITFMWGGGGGARGRLCIIIHAIT